MDGKAKVMLPAREGFVADHGGRRYECTHVECSVSYDRGGNGRKRGYYMRVRPVTVKNGNASRRFDGGEWLLVECDRKSSVKETIAQVLFETHVKAAVKYVFVPDNIDLGPLPPSPTERLQWPESLI